MTEDEIESAIKDLLVMVDDYPTRDEAGRSRNSAIRESYIRGWVNACKHLLERQFEDAESYMKERVK